MGTSSSTSKGSIHDFTSKDGKGNIVDLSIYKGKVLSLRQCRLRMEPGSNEQIVETACTRFEAEFPIFSKVDVNGKNAAPVYKFLKSRKCGLLGENIKWNFTKFLVDKEGHVVDRYAPTTSPSNKH